MTCSGAYASAAEYDALMCANLDLTDADVLAEVNSYLALAASDVHVALAAVGACDCTLASWATAYLKKLNIIDAAVVHNCSCGRRLNDDQRDRWREWLERQYELIYSGKITVCSGDTGSDYPAIAWAEMSYTEWNAEQIANNEAMRDLP